MFTAKDTQGSAHFYSEALWEYGVEKERNFTLEKAESTGMCVVQEHRSMCAS